MEVNAIENLFATNVYKQDNRYDFVERMRRVLIEQKPPRISQLLNNYRTKARNSFSYILESRENTVYLSNYVDAIRCMLMIEWLRLNFVVKFDSDTTTKLVETNFTRLFEESTAHLNKTICKAIENTMSRTKNNNLDSKIKKVPILDDWLLERITSSYDTFLLAETNEKISVSSSSPAPSAISTFREILDSNLKIKFEKYKQQQSSL